MLCELLLGPRFCCQFPQTLLTRSGDVIHPQLRPLGLGKRLDFPMSVINRMLKIKVGGGGGGGAAPLAPPPAPPALQSTGNCSYYLPTTTIAFLHQKEHLSLSSYNEHMLNHRRIQDFPKKGGLRPAIRNARGVGVLSALGPTRKAGGCPL